MRVNCPDAKRHGQHGDVVDTTSKWAALVKFEESSPAEWYARRTLVLSLPPAPDKAPRIESQAGAVGTKHDAGKPRWSLLPLGFVRGVVEVLEVGAAEYGADNWQQVTDARRRYYDAANRHLDAWWDGERNDPDDGLHHLLHVACCVSFAWWMEVNRKGEPCDDE